MLLRCLGIAVLAVGSLVSSISVACENAEGVSVVISGHGSLPSIDLTTASIEGIAAEFGADGTVLIAAKELQQSLSPYQPVTVSFDSIPCGASIVLSIDLQVAEQSYEFRQRDGIIEIVGRPIGLLYGVYDLLQRAGFEWHAPDSLWAISPAELTLPADLPSERARPLMTLRGARTDEGANIPNDYLIWMARNRLNLVGVSGTNWKLAEALGIKLEGGGHSLISEILSNERIVDGTRLADLHPEWYGEAHPPIEAGSDFYENPCFAAPGIAEFFANDIGERLLKGDLKHVSMLDIWPSDQVSLSIPSSCPAPGPDAKPVDHLFDFIGKVMDSLQPMLETADPARNIVIAGISYYDLWDVPNASILQRLSSRPNVAYTHVFYVNERSYSQPLNAPEGSTNSDIFAALQDWSNAFRPYAITIGICEYYNYSIYNSLPATYSHVIKEDVQAYVSLGSDVHTYMHPIGGDPGPNRYQEVIRSRALWSAHASVDYFSSSFGDKAAEIERAYEMGTKALANVAEMWGAVGGLEQLITQKTNWSSPPLTDDQVRSAIPDYLEGGQHSLPNVRNTHFSPLRTEFVGLDQSVRGLTEVVDLLENALASSQADIKRRIEIDLMWYKFALAQYQILQTVARAFQVGGEYGNVLPLIEDSMRELEKNDMFNRTLSPLDQRRRFATSLHALRQSLSQPLWYEETWLWLKRMMRSVF